MSYNVEIVSASLADVLSRHGITLAQYFQNDPGNRASERDTFAEAEMYLRSNISGSTDSYQIQNLVQNATESQAQTNARMEELRQANAPLTYIESQSDFWTYLIGRLNKIAQDVAITQKPPAQLAQDTYDTTKESWKGPDEAWARSEEILDDARRRIDEAALELTKNPNSEKAKNDLEYWSTYQTLMKGDKVAIDVESKEDMENWFADNTYDPETQNPDGSRIWTTTEYMALAGAGLAVVIVGLVIWSKMRVKG